MSKIQVDKFVNQFAPEAALIVTEQWNADAATRSLVCNPFYLRLLTRAARMAREANQPLDQALGGPLSRRGWLLTYLIHNALSQELKSEKLTTPQLQEKVDRYISGLGVIAEKLMQRNHIGGLPFEQAKALLGAGADSVLRSAENAGILGISDDDGKQEIFFNHQLFLELMLANRFYRQLDNAESFQNLLSLLSRRGDRWAETIKLLSEMLTPVDEKKLIDHCLNGLREIRTWDISVSVLSDIGENAQSDIRQLLTVAKNPLRRRGACVLIGRRQDAEAAPALAELFKASESSVREAAVQALEKIGRLDLLDAFEKDASRRVRREVYKAKILAENAPAAFVTKLLETKIADAPEVARAVRATYEHFTTSCEAEEVGELLHAMFSVDHDVVKATGLMLAGSSTPEVRDSCKAGLLELAIGSPDENISSLAGYALRGALIAADETSILHTEKTIRHDLETSKQKSIQHLKLKNKIKPRVQALLLEIRRDGPQSELFAQFEAMDLAARRGAAMQLARRNDPTAIAMLTALLAQEVMLVSAAIALVSIGDEGVQHLLNCLDDDDVAVRINVARLLRFCTLPRIYGGKVRRNLAESTIRIPRTPVGDAPFSDPNVLGVVHGAERLNLIGLTPALMLNSYFWGEGIGFLYWLIYAQLHGGKPDGIPWSLDDRNTAIIHAVERLAFKTKPREVNIINLVARARILEKIGKREIAINTFERALGQAEGMPSMDNAHSPALLQFELALLHRKKGSFADARAALSRISERDRDEISGVEALETLLGSDMALATGEIDANEPPFTERAHALASLNEDSELIALLTEATDMQLRTVPNWAGYIAGSFAGIGAFAEAVGAAEYHKETAVGAEPIPDATIRNWRLKLPSSKLDTRLVGTIAFRLAMKDDRGAITALFSDAELLPTVGKQLDEEQMSHLKRLPERFHEPMIAAYERLRSEDGAALDG